jgi:hypothetical protein
MLVLLTTAAFSIETKLIQEVNGTEPSRSGADLRRSGPLSMDNWSNPY